MYYLFFQNFLKNANVVEIDTCLFYLSNHDRIKRIRQIA